jgi:DNA polymerase V
MSVNIIKTFVTKETYPYHSSPAAAGFPSPGEEFMDETLSLNELLIKRPTSTFFMKIQGDSMQEAHLYDGDIVIVDRSLTPLPGNIVIATINGELVIKRLEKIGNTYQLTSENPAYTPFVITEELDSLIWGVVTFTIHRTR